ncbi:hypothetical protein DSO57_1025027 [Entomophthora muscae]|uniref:Uncharacterized protein n=1 Tax=Entomophthora muscae TaxID=34485 RepID=A0ACC2UN11_9FUNG|nr:hypothetical protein DSO57_1025027 [Entomophthora muscae]
MWYSRLQTALDFLASLESNLLTAEFNLALENFYLVYFYLASTSKRWEDIGDGFKKMTSTHLLFSMEFYSQIAGVFVASPDCPREVISGLLKVTLSRQARRNCSLDDDTGDFSSGGSGHLFVLSSCPFVGGCYIEGAPSISRLEAMFRMG